MASAVCASPCPRTRVTVITCSRLNPMSRKTFARAVASLSARKRTAASGSSALGRLSARWIAWSSSRSIPVSAHIWGATHNAVIADDATGQRIGATAPRICSTVKPLASSHATSSARSARACPSRPSSSPALRFDVFGHGLNVYRSRCCIQQ